MRVSLGKVFRRRPEQCWLYSRLPAVGRPNSDSCGNPVKALSRDARHTLHSCLIQGVPPNAIHRLAAAVASGGGTRVAATLPPETRAVVANAARAGTASGLNDVLLAAAAFAALAAVVGFAFGPDPVKRAPAVDQPTNPRP